MIAVLFTGFATGVIPDTRLHCSLMFTWFVVNISLGSLFCIHPLRPRLRRTRLPTQARGTVSIAVAVVPGPPTA